MKCNWVKMYLLELEDLFNLDDCDEDVMIDIFFISDDRLDICKLDKWFVILYVYDRFLEFCIDIGVKCNVIIMLQYIKVDLYGNEQKFQKILCLFINYKICLEFCVDLLFISYIGDIFIIIKFEVVNVLQENIIIGFIVEKFNFIMCVDIVECDLVQLGQFSDFLDLICIIGIFLGEYKIKIDEYVKGVIYLVCCQLVLLKLRIIEKLREMELDGYIVFVEEFIEWVSLMVVSFRNNKVRICIDFKDFNEVIKREYYFMKIVEEVLFFIFGVKIFLVFDVKFGYM